MQIKSTYSELYSAAVEAAQIGGKILLANAHRARSVKFDQKSAYDYVSEVDKASQNAIIEFIARRFPGHAVLAEEEGGGIQGSEYRWIIDPLDGTTNYLHNFPVFAVSVAVEKYSPAQDGFGKIVAGTVINPVLSEIYSAAENSGAYLNEIPIRVSSQTDFGAALLATGFPFRDKEYLTEFLRIFQNMFISCNSVRRAGAAALDQCWVASGVLDGFWEKGLAPWDIAAGSLIITEAGGVVSDFCGLQEYMSSGNIIAAPAQFHQNMLELISK